MSHFIDLQFFLLWLSHLYRIHTPSQPLYDFDVTIKAQKKGRHCAPTRRGLRLMFSACEKSVFMLACLFLHLAHL